MTNTFELNKMGLLPLEKAEMLETNGGINMTTFLELLWNCTPDGGSSSWVNNGSGTFLGTTSNGGYGFINPSQNYWQLPR